MAVNKVTNNKASTAWFFPTKDGKAGGNFQFESAVTLQQAKKILKSNKNSLGIDPDVLDWKAGVISWEGNTTKLKPSIAVSKEIKTAQKQYERKCDKLRSLFDKLQVVTSDISCEAANMSYKVDEFTYELGWDQIKEQKELMKEYKTNLKNLQKLLDKARLESDNLFTFVEEL